MKIVVSEDSTVSQKILLHVLRQLSLEATIITEGNKVFEAVASDPNLNFLLLNWVMPGMSGPALCKRVRKLSLKDRLRPYIILLTSKASKASIIEGIEAGADDFIGKPFDANLLRIRLNVGQRILSAAKERQDHALAMRRSLERHMENLNYAKRLQQNLNTANLPTLKDVYIKSFFMPSEELSGDFFEIQKVQQKIVIFLADYSGHGIKVAINAAISKSVADRRFPLLHQERLEDFFYHLNNDLFKYISRNGEFCTAFACIIDLKQRLMHYCNASHPLPILVRDGALVDYPNTNNFFLGYQTKTTFHSKTQQLEERDRLWLYSDAAYEVIRNGKVVFNEKDLRRSILRLAQKNVNESFERLMQVLRSKNKGFPLEDDCTILVVQQMPPYKITKTYRRLEEMEKPIVLLRRELYRHEFPENDIEKIVVCFNELFINAIEHGNKKNPKKKVTVSLSIDFKRCVVVVGDEGEGHAQVKVRHPATKSVMKALDEATIHEPLYHGRGIWMVKRFSSSLKFNSKGNQVTVTFEQKRSKTMFASGKGY